MNVNTLMGHDVESIDLKTKNLNGHHQGFAPGLPESGRRILVLGVDLKTWTGLSDSLWDLGFTLKSLPSSLDELDQLKDTILDGILWDFESSFLKGLAVVSQLRGRTPVLPVMVISRPSNKQLLIKAIENGAMDFIMKPIDHTELRNNVCGCLDRG